MPRENIFHVLAALLSLHVATAQFQSGSTGADGALNVTADRTIALPPDGVLNYTTITVAANRTLRFTRNSLNTPVYLLATGAVQIDGTIDVSGKPSTGPVGGAGGPGGFDGGFGGYNLDNRAGDGLGPGGGKGNNASGKFQSVYGNSLLVPLVGGSGSAGRDGNPGSGGCGGGGAILIASTLSVTINGAINAVGGAYSMPQDNQYYPAGSGGAVRIVAPIVKGTGHLNTKGGRIRRPTTFPETDSFAESGRIRIDCTDSLSFRSLTSEGRLSRGSRMFVTPANGLPRLDIVRAAGQEIPLGAQTAVSLELPVGSPATQVVRVQGRNFTQATGIRVVVTPENGPSRSFDSTLPGDAGPEPFVDVNVTLSAGVVNQINAWTR